MSKIRNQFKIAKLFAECSPSLVGNVKHMLCGGFSKTNLSDSTDLYLELKYSISDQNPP